MKQLFFLLIFLSFSVLAQPPQAESSPARIERLASQSLLLDITQVDNKFAIAVGERGHILRSTDGDNWQQSQVPVQATLTKVFFVDAEYGWAVGHDATILITKDGGVTWSVQQFIPKIQRPLFDVYFSDRLNGVAIGAYGLMYRTSDGGESWASEFHEELLIPDDRDYLQELKAEDYDAYLDERSSILPHFNRLLVDGKTLFLAGEIGLLAKSNDVGRTWELLDEIYMGSFFDIARTQAGNLLVVGLRGNVFHSRDNGTSWQHVDTGTTALLNKILLVNNKINVLGNAGIVLTSENDGLNFEKQVQEDGKALISGISFQGKIIATSEVGIKVISAE